MKNSSQVGWTVAASADAWCVDCAATKGSVLSRYDDADKAFVESSVEPVFRGDELTTLTCNACDIKLWYKSERSATPKEQEQE